MGFTKRGLEEQKFLKENYPNLWKLYDEYMGNICIPESRFRNEEALRNEVFKIIAVHSNYSRYVLFRDIMSDDEGNPCIPCYVVCQADCVE